MIVNTAWFYVAGLLFCSTTMYCNSSKSDGKYILKFEKDGNIRSRVVGATLNGKREGLWINYDELGEVVGFDTYLNDSITGQSVNYYESGKVMSVGMLENGQRSGEWTIFYLDQKIAQRGSYLHGERVGVSEFYVESGKLDKKVEYLADGSKKVIVDNHLSLPVPESMEPAPIIDSNNHAESN